MKLKQISLFSLILASSLFGTIHGSAPQESCDQKKLKEDNAQLKKKLATMKFQDINAMGKSLLAMEGKTQEHELRSLTNDYFHQTHLLFTEENKQDVFKYIESVKNLFGSTQEADAKKLFSQLAYIGHWPIFRLMWLDMFLDKAYHL